MNVLRQPLRKRGCSRLRIIAMDVIVKHPSVTVLVVSVFHVRLRA